MKIEVGKTYKTKDLRKATIYAHRNGLDWPFVGVIDGKKCWNAWDEYGVTNSSDSRLDLIAEWDFDPIERRMWAVIFSNGVIHVCNTETDANVQAATTGFTPVRIAVPVLVKEIPE